MPWCAREVWPLFVPRENDDDVSFPLVLLTSTCAFMSQVLICVAYYCTLKFIWP